MVTATQGRLAGNMRIMRALLLKDWRFFRVQVVTLLIVAAAAYVLPLTASPDTTIQGKLQTFESGALTAFLLTAGIAAVLGGAAIAGERAESTCDFLATLPVSRLQISVSKWIVSSVALIFFAGVHLVIYRWVAHSRYGDYMRSTSWESLLFGYAVYWVGATVCLFGVSWMLSSLTRSAVISSAVGVLTTLSVVIFVYYAGLDVTHSEPWNHPRGEYLGASITATIGTASLVAGTFVYLRRVKP